MGTYTVVLALLALALLAMLQYEVVRKIRARSRECQPRGGEQQVEVPPAADLMEQVVTLPAEEGQPEVTREADLLGQIAPLQAEEGQPEVSRDADLLEQIAVLQAEKDQLEAKYLKKLKAAEEKKRNLAKYRQGKRDTRKHKSIPDQAAEIVNLGNEWLPHSCSEAKSHKIGKPQGGRGAGRPRPQVIHQEVELCPKECDRCHADLGGQEAYFARDAVVTELFHDFDELGHFKYRQLKNIRKKVYRKRCPSCGKWVYPQQGLFRHARFGVAFVCYVISERIQTRLPYEQLIQSMARDFGGAFSLSETAIIDWFLKFEDQLEDMYAQLEALLTVEEFLHVDETGAPMNGENWWLWVLCTANVVLYKLSESRGHQSVEDIVQGYDGTIIADFFRAYDMFKDNEQQKCLAHLLSAIIEIVVKRDKENGRIGKALEQHAKAVQAEALAGDPAAPKKRGRKAKAAKLPKKQLEVLRQRKEVNDKAIRQGTRLRAFFKLPFDEQSPLGWQSPQPNKMSSIEAKEQMLALVAKLRAEGVEDEEIRKILDRCEKYQDSLFTYLDHEGMPPDNNEAERKLRPFAVQRRVSGGFKSPPLMKHFAVFLSLFMTCKANVKEFEALLPRVLSEEGVDLRQFLLA